MATYKKRGYLLENFRLFHLRSQGGTQTDYHYHEFCKLLLLVSGSGGYFIDGERYLLQSGDILFIDSRSIHRPELDADTPYERIIIYISPEYLQKHSTADCDLTALFSGTQGRVLRLRENRRKPLFQLAAALEKDLEGDSFGREIVSSAGLLRLLVETGRNIRRSGTFGPSPVMPKNDRIREIMAYIDANLTEDMDADTLAQEFYISKYHMMRLFRQEPGTTVHNYITQKRLLLARELIDGGMRSTEACYRCGWHSYSSFTRACAKYLGSTPTGRPEARYAPEEGME